MPRIYFVQSESEILKQSYPALKQLLTILNEHPKMSVLIEGHTENRGKPEALLKLSKERASKVKGYLVEKGIIDDRLEIIGYGATKPAAYNKNERLRQQNRRVEVKILKN